MCDICVKGKGFQMDLTVNPSADFIGCLLTGVLAAMPAFLEAFMKCLGGTGGTGGFSPGDRRRC